MNKIPIDYFIYHTYNFSIKGEHMLIDYIPIIGIAVVPEFFGGGGG